MAIEYSSGQAGAPAPSGAELVLDADMLPEGIAATLKDGDIVRMRVVGSPDADGAVTVVYDTGGTSGEPMEETESESPELAGPAPEPSETMEEGETGDWEEDFRKAMSPRNQQTEAA